MFKRNVITQTAVTGVNLCEGSSAHPAHLLSLSLRETKVAVLPCECGHPPPQLSSTNQEQNANVIDRGATISFHALNPLETFDLLKAAFVHTWVWVCWPLKRSAKWLSCRKVIAEYGESRYSVWIRCFSTETEGWAASARDQPTMMSRGQEGTRARINITQGLFWFYSTWPSKQLYQSPVSFDHVS